MDYTFEDMIKSDFPCDLILHISQAPQHSNIYTKDEILMAQALIAMGED